LSFDRLSVREILSAREILSSAPQDLLRVTYESNISPSPTETRTLPTETHLSTKLSPGSHRTTLAICPPASLSPAWLVPLDDSRVSDGQAVADDPFRPIRAASRNPAALNRSMTNAATAAKNGRWGERRQAQSTIVSDGPFEKLITLFYSRAFEEYTTSDLQSEVQIEIPENSARVIGCLDGKQMSEY